MGAYRAEHFFTLQQSLEAYRQYQKWVSACDVEIEDRLGKLPSKPLPTRSLSPNQKMPISPDGTNYALICAAIFTAFLA